MGRVLVVISAQNAFLALSVIPICSSIERISFSSDAEILVDTGLVYQDELTGAVVMHRPDIKRLMEVATVKRFDIVVMKSIKRLGRDTLGLLMLKRFLDDLGIEVVGLQDGYRSFRDQELIFLIQTEREDLAKNVRCHAATSQTWQVDVRAGRI